MGGKWRKILTSTAAAKENVGKVKKVILETTAEFKKHNPIGMACKNGEKFIRPEFSNERHMERLLKDKEEKEAKLASAENQEEQKIAQLEVDKAVQKIEESKEIAKQVGDKESYEQLKNKASNEL